MTLRHLKIFVTVYLKGSITKASEELHMAQPAVSLAIKEIETYYGVCLFNRLARKIFPTETAEKFYEHASQIISLFEKMEHNIKDWEALGTLRIGTTITIGNFVLPTLIEMFKEAYANIKVQVTINNSRTIEKLLVDNEVDLVLLEGRCHHKDMMKEIPFLKDELCLIVSKHHVLASKKHVVLKDLENCDLLFREDGSAERELLNSIFIANNIVIQPIWDSVSTKALVRGVRKNLGISILPYLFVKEDLLDGEVIKVNIEDIDLMRQFMVIYNKNKYLSESANAFVELCKNWEVSKGRCA